MKSEEGIEKHLLSFFDLFRMVKNRKSLASLKLYPQQNARIIKEDKHKAGALKTKQKSTRNAPIMMWKGVRETHKMCFVSFWKYIAHIRTREEKLEIFSRQTSHIPTFFFSQSAPHTRNGFFKELVSEVFNHPPNKTGSSVDYELTVLIILLSHLLYSFDTEELYTETTTVRSKRILVHFLLRFSRWLGFVVFHRRRSLMCSRSTKASSNETKKWSEKGEVPIYVYATRIGTLSCWRCLYIIKETPRSYNTIPYQQKTIIILRAKKVK